MVTCSVYSWAASRDRLAPSAGENGASFTGLVLQQACQIRRVLRQTWGGAHMLSCERWELVTGERGYQDA